MILTVLLTILKILGIIFLSIIGLVLLVLLLILFVPIRYKAAFARTGLPEDPPVEAKATVSWLLHLIHITVSYSQNMIMCIRVLGIPIYRKPGKELTSDELARKEKKAKAKEIRKAQKEEKKQVTQKCTEKQTSTKDNSDITDGNTNEDAHEFERIEISEDELLAEEETPEDVLLDEEEVPQDNDDSPEKTSIFSKIINLIKSIKCTCKTVYDKIKHSTLSAKEKVDSAKKNIHYYHVILTSDLFERTFANCKRKVIKLLKEILPRKFQINMEVGLDDPYTMGELLGIAGMMYPLIGEHVKIVPDWDENVFRGAGRLKGRIFVFSFLKIGVFYLTNRDLKKLIRLLKKEERRNGRK